jgi:hypothetical protein
MRCRHCGAEVDLCLIDLGAAPPSNAYLLADDLSKPETWYPLKVMVCSNCWLAQTADYAQRTELFSDSYAYFSSFSETWLQHARCYVNDMVERFTLSSASTVIEVAANDGCLLQYVRDKGIRCIGIEPTASTARVCRERQIEVVEDFFGTKLAESLLRRGLTADLMTANNVLAHVPDINDFVAGFFLLLKPHGVATFEFPHLLRLVQHCQFDTIYHEHFSYLCLTAVLRIFQHQRMNVFDVQELETHGGSLRLFVQRGDTGVQSATPAVAAMLRLEQEAGLTSAHFYAGFQERADHIKDDLLRFLLDVKQAGKRVGAYGAAAKGNTLLNYAGIRRDLVPWVADRSPAKQGKYMPGSRIPIVSEAHLRYERPHYIWILPWNLRSELTEQLSYIREWGAQFVVAVPKLEIL